MSSKTIRITELKRGNESEFENLYDRYYSDLCLYIFNLNRDQQKAEDLVQDVMLSIWKNRSSLNITTSLKAFLYRCCYNAFIDSYKKNQKESAYFVLLKTESLLEIEEEDQDFLDWKMKMVSEQIDRLPKKCKQVFLLVKESGLKYQEVAETLNISVKTVEIHMSKAFRKIKEGLAEESFQV